MSTLINDAHVLLLKLETKADDYENQIVVGYNDIKAEENLKEKNR